LKTKKLFAKVVSKKKSITKEWSVQNYKKHTRERNRYQKRPKIGRENDHQVLKRERGKFRQEEKYVPAEKRGGALVERKPKKGQ